MEDKDIIDLDSQVNNPNQVYVGVKPKLPNATAALVLGIISLVTMCAYGIPGLITGIIGFVLARKDKQLYDQNPSKWDESSYKNSNAGYICSIIGMSISALIILVFVFIFIAAATTAATTNSVFNDAMMEALEESRYDNY